MTTANKLTILRVLLIPVMVIVLYIEPLKVDSGFIGMSVAQLIFATLFIFASFTDFLDGYIARKYDQISTFGKFLDPIADKMLVFTALLYLMTVMPLRVTLWSVVIIIVREFLITGFRLLAVEKGSVIAASNWGKYKTITTMVAIIIFLFNDFGLTSINTSYEWIGNSVYYLAIFFTIFSGIDYLYRNRSIISLKK